MNRRDVLRTVGGLSIAGLAGCTTRSAIEDRLFDTAEFDIGMSRNRFEPIEYTASVGETIRWKNTSEADHTVTAYDSGLPEEAEYFASGRYADETEARDAWDQNRGGSITTRETYEHTFSTPGMYPYVCIPHEPGGMVGMIVIEESE